MGKQANQTKTRPLAARWLHEIPLTLLIIVLAVVLLVAIGYGATRRNIGNPPKPQSPATSTSTPTVVFNQQLINQQSAPELAKLRAAIASIEAKYGLLLGLSISMLAPPLQATQHDWHGGALYGGEALDTIALPMSLALVNEAKRPPNLDYLLAKALSQDSAAGIQAIWAYLGDPDQAAAKTNAAFVQYGDLSTKLYVNSDESVDYGRTNWRLDQQIKMVSALGCGFRQNYRVIEKLKDGYEEQPNQLWGFQLLPMSYIASASGYDHSGQALVRQLGITRLADGTQVAIAAAASTSEHDPAIAKEALTDLAWQLRDNAQGIKPPACK